MDESFWVYGEYEMPANFYDNVTGSLRPFASMWNHDTRWRVGLWIDSSKLPRLQLETDAGLTVLWQGQTRIPTGRHTIALHFSFSKTNGLTELYVDDILWKSVIAPNVPKNFLNPVSTQILWFFDGANKQTRDIDMTWYKIGASNISPIKSVDVCKPLRDIYESAKKEKTIKKEKYDSVLEIFNIVKYNLEKSELELNIAIDKEMDAFVKLNQCEGNK